MTGMFLPGGKRAMAQMLAGAQLPINGMYAEYGAAKVLSVVGKDYNYFQRLIDSDDPSRGFARIAVTGTEVDELTASVTFTGMVVDSDFIKHPAPGSLINAVTLCHFRNTNQYDDILMYTLILPQPVKLVDGSLISIRAGLSFGVTNG